MIHNGEEMTLTNKNSWEENARQPICVHINCFNDYTRARRYYYKIE